MAYGFRTLLPRIPSFMLGTGTIVPVKPLPTTAQKPRSLVSGLDIHQQITTIRTSKGDQNLASAMTSIQEYADNNDQRMREALGSVGLFRDPAGNVSIKAGTFTVSLPLQSLKLFNGNLVQGAPAAAPADSTLLPSSLTMWLDEATPALKIRVRKSDGTYHTFTVL